MDLVVRLFAGLRDRAGQESLHLTGLPEGLTVAELKALVAKNWPQVGSLEGVAGVVGTSWVPDERVLQPGDALALLPPVSGGEATPEAEQDALERGVFLLSRLPLDCAAILERVRSAECGALVSFLGTTRNQHQGRAVLRLEYEAFEEMTGPEMARIYEDVRKCHGPVVGGHARMITVHRTGTVAVGEPSVVIAVATPHRRDAFVLAQALIDGLKERLPIWKREVYEDGSHWVGERS